MENSKTIPTGGEKVKGLNSALIIKRFCTRKHAGQVQTQLSSIRLQIPVEGTRCVQAVEARLDNPSKAESGWVVSVCPAFHDVFVRI